MMPLFISMIPSETTTLAIIGTVLAVCTALMIIKNSDRLSAGRKFSPVYNVSPSGAVDQIRRPHRRLEQPAMPRKAQYAMSVQPTGSVRSIGSNVPDYYSGPVVVEGSKYQWESRWSHLPSFEQGREGEERVVNTLINSLGKGWYIFRNFVLPTEDEDIDLVLVGPAGVFAMEVKIYTGEVKLERNRCYIKTAQGRIYRQRREPVAQVRKSAARLNSFFKEHGIAAHTTVRPLTVMSGDSPIELASTQPDVCTLRGLRARIGEIADHTQFSQAEVRQLASVMQAAMQEQTRSNLSRIH